MGIPRSPQVQRVLILGWNRKVSVLLQEFNSYGRDNFNIDILSIVSVVEREDYIKRFAGNLECIDIQQLWGDYTAMAELKNFDPQKYDTIVLVSSDWVKSAEESDARTIIGYLLLKTIFEGHNTIPKTLMELIDPENEKLFPQQTGEVIISPLKDFAA